MPEDDSSQAILFPGTPIRVLLVDDHQILREGLRRLLEADARLSVVGEAANGRSGVELALQLKPHVVVMDVSMPEMNGLDATAALKPQLPETKVIGLSMHSDSDLVRLMIDAGASGFLTKDCAEQDLVSAILCVMTGKPYFSASITLQVMGGRATSAIADQAQSGAALAPRERQLVRLLAAGKNTKEIADELGLSPKTIDIYRRRLMQHLELGSIAELTKFAIREGLTSVES